MRVASSELELRISPPFLPEDEIEVERFLKERGLSYEPADFRVAYLSASKLIAVGSLDGKVIKGLAVAEGLRGEGLAARIVSNLEAQAARRGDGRLRAFTSPGNREIFESLGYRTIASAGDAAILLERSGGIDAWCARLTEERGRQPGRASGSRGDSALVMNCNPFTIGHRHLVEYASEHSDRVFLFVVQEEASSFPFAVRRRLVAEGCAGLENVRIIAGSDYVISRSTFPTYFLKDRVGEAAAIHARLDLDLFGRWIAPALGVTRRFVAQEPYSEVTALYNVTMHEVLPALGIEVVEIPRFAVGGRAVSASSVRALIREGRLGEVRHLVPESTWKYLNSSAAKEVLEGLAATEGRH